LELLVTLAILALVATMIAAGMRSVHADSGTDVVRVADFVATLRAKAVLAGKPIVAKLTSQSLVTSTGRLDLGADTTINQLGEFAAAAGVLVAYPDGTLSGGGLKVTAGQKVSSVPGPFRDEVQSGSHG
jgi:hypothetical protein